MERRLAALERQLERAQSVIRLQRSIQEVGHDVDAVLQTVVEAAMSLTEAHGAVIELVEGDELVYRAGAGMATGSVGFRLPAAGSLSGLCVAEQRAMRSDDTAADPRVNQEACERVGARSMVVVPLPDGARCHGVLKVYADVVAAFDDEALALLEQLASFIAVALRNAGDYEQRQHQALHDPLTHLPNRALGMERLAAALADSRRRSHPVSVGFVDLDGFKGVNDTLGHAAGDERLVEAARRLRSVVRDGDTVARIGGDEFLVVCPGADGHDAERVRARITSALHAAPPVPASVGVVASEVGEETASLLARADEAMYADKQARR